jgi:hypothetical protein
MPVADDDDHQQNNRHQKQSGSFGGVDGMAVLMIVIGWRLPRSGGVHGAIVTFSVVCLLVLVRRWSLVIGR